MVQFAVLGNSGDFRLETCTLTGHTIRSTLKRAFVLLSVFIWPLKAASHTVGTCNQVYDFVVFLFNNQTVKSLQN